PELLVEREWLVTNGIGGYASGTLSGAVTRRYHGLLVAALPPPMGRLLMLGQIAEELFLPGDIKVEICSGVGSQETRESPGFASLAEFCLEDGLPVWLFKIDQISLEKRLLMIHRQNTVLVTYKLLTGGERLKLRLRPLIHFRLHEEPVAPLTERYEFSVGKEQFEIATKKFRQPLRLLLHSATSSHAVDHNKIQGVYYRAEHQRGYEAVGDLCSPGFFEIDLEPRKSATLIASAEPWEQIHSVFPERAYLEEHARRRALLSQAHADTRAGPAAELVLAADQFLICPVGRLVDSADDGQRHTIIAGYHWFTDWGRDTMISLEGLTLVTGRYREARKILACFAETIRDGLIPNLFPEGARNGLYHTADATLWFFHAVDRYLWWTGDRDFLHSLLPKLADIVDHHLHGTQFGIGVDPTDGLLRQGEEGYQLTWMDAKVGDWVVTPRRGKAVEINALWYNALRLLEVWLAEEGRLQESGIIERSAAQVMHSFNERFWYGDGGYLYDVVDGEQGDDSSCRPNQVLAFSLPYPVLERARWERVLTIVEDRLLTPYGLRSLSAEHPDYKEKYFGDLRSRDAAYHQGTVWAWLIGPFIDAWLRVHPGDFVRARGFLNGLIAHLGDAGIGTISEVFDAEPPFRPRGCIAQAWSVAETLRCWVKTTGEPNAQAKT
ncbi:MAG TPA: amylo-alpha-1,6-glucosidase, partial [Candidatus Binatia bacterium]|nr:amylo-alpha-1,6-glucosidase [Candidatus Binatia bacterium]